MTRTTTHDAGRGRWSFAALLVVVGVVSALLCAAPAQAADATATLSGRMVTSDGSAWDSSPWTVTALPVDGAGREVSTSLAGDGSYELTGVPVGRYRLRAVPAEEHSGVPAMWHGRTLREDRATVVDVAPAATLDQLDIVRIDPSEAPSRAGSTSGLPPYVNGTPKVGWTLTAQPRTWTITDEWLERPMPVLDDMFTYQWLADGVAVEGATSRTFAPSAAELGKALEVRVGVDAPNATVTTPDTSPATAAVVAGSNAPCSRVTLLGKAKVGRSLVAKRSRCWAAPGTKVTHTWYVDGRKVGTTTSPKIRLRKAYRGDRVAVKVTASAPGYAKAAVRTKTRKVR